MPPIIPEEAAEFAPGVYLGEVKGCEQKVSKSSGNEMFVVTWKLVGFYSESDITDYITFSKKAAGLTGAKLGVFGFDVGDDVKAIDLLGKRAYLNVVHESFEGRVSCRVGVSFDNGCRGGYWSEGNLPNNVPIVEPDTGASTPF